MAIKAKLLPRWPSAITGTAPIVATKANGAVALSYDSSSLPQVSSPTGSGKVVVREGAVYNEVPALNIAFPTIANNTLVGNNSGGTAAPSALTAAQAAALLPAVVGDSGSGGTKGLAPAPSAGDAAAGKYLKADGTYAVPSGAVSSVAGRTGAVTLDGTDVAFTQAGTGADTRNVTLKLREVASVKDFGATGNGSTDDLAAINEATASGYSLFWPDGTYRVTGTITCTTAQEWVANGVADIVYDAAGGSAAAPVCDFRETVFIRGPFNINQQSNTKTFVNPTVYAGNLALGSAVMVQGDYSVLSGLTVKNGFDNCIGVGRYNPTTGVQTVGSPKYVKIDSCHTNNGGCGVLTAGPSAGTQAGAGINFLTGALGNVVNCTDLDSRTGFIVDYGGGAQANFTNCSSFFARKSTGSFASLEATPGGQGFYLQGASSTAVNCLASDSERIGFLLDGYAQGCNLTGCIAKASGMQGFRILGADNTLTSPKAISCSYASAGTYAAIRLEGTADNGGGGFTDSTNIYVVSPVTTGSNHKYGLEVIHPGGLRVFGFVSGGKLTGTTSQMDIADPATFLVSDVFDLYSDALSSRGRKQIRRLNVTYTTQAFGDSANNGTLFLEDGTTRDKRLAMGMDPSFATNGAGVIQSIYSGNYDLPLLLNPSGGAVLLGEDTVTVGAPGADLPYMPSGAGAPTGAPTVYSGWCPFYYDTTNNKLWIYNGSWRGVVLA